MQEIDSFTFPDDLDKITPKDFPAACSCAWCELRRRKEQRRKERKELEKQNNSITQNSKP